MTRSHSRPRAIRLLAAVLVALVALVGLAGLPARSGSAATIGMGGPSTDAAAAAEWVARLVGPDGSVENPFGGGPSVTWTVNVALSLAASGSEPDALARALGYIEDNLAVYVERESGDDAGGLGYLLVLVDAVGADPRSFGGSDLIARLEALYEKTETGFYGVVDPFSAVMDQSLSIIGLDIFGISVPQGAIDWLVAQQCREDGSPANSLGGYAPYRATVGGVLELCPPADPAGFSGPDLNLTSFAVMALAAVDALDELALDPLAFFRTAQITSGPRAGGFSWYPGTCPEDDPFSAACPDPNTTAVVLMALVAAGETAERWATPGGTPIDSLESWVVRSGPDEGSLSSPYSSGDADVFASYQGVWGLVGQTLPLLPPPPLPEPESETLGAGRDGEGDGGTVLRPAFTG